MIYYFFISALCVIIFHYSALLRKADYFLCIALAGIIIFISGFRHGVGVDYASYVEIYNDIVSGMPTHVEAGYQLLNLIAFEVGASAQFVFLVMALLTVFFAVRYIFFFSNWPALSLIMYALMPVFYLASFNGVRQFLAVTIFAFSLKYLVCRKIARYCLFVMLASCFHVTAILLLPLYFFLNRRYSLVYYLVGFLFFIYLLSNVEIIMGIIGIPLHYLNGEGYSQGGGLNSKSFVLLLIFLILYVFKEKLASCDSNSNIFLNMLYVAALFSIVPVMLGLPSALFIRMSSYFTIALIIILPNWCASYGTALWRYLAGVSLLLMASLYYWAVIIFSGEGNKLLPFEFSFELI